MDFNSYFRSNLRAIAPDLSQAQRHQIESLFEQCIKMVSILTSTNAAVGATTSAAPTSPTRVRIPSPTPTPVRSNSTVKKSTGGRGGAPALPLQQSTSTSTAPPTKTIQNQYNPIQHQKITDTLAQKARARITTAMVVQDGVPPTTSNNNNTKAPTRNVNKNTISVQQLQQQQPLTPTSARILSPTPPNTVHDDSHNNSNSLNISSQVASIGEIPASPKGQTPRTERKPEVEIGYTKMMMNNTSRQQPNNSLNEYKSDRARWYALQYEMMRRK
eukprot:PhF_6_TR21159/c1_g1_i2/m.30473